MNKENIFSLLPQIYGHQSGFARANASAFSTSYSSSAFANASFDGARLVPSTAAEVFASSSFAHLIFSNAAARRAAHEAVIAAAATAREAKDTIDGLRRIVKVKRDAGASAASRGQAAPTLPVEERAPHVIMGVSLGDDMRHGTDFLVAHTELSFPLVQAHISLSTHQNTSFFSLA